MTDEQTARKIMADAQYDGYLNDDVSAAPLEAAIVRALQAARTPPPGHIIDDAGVVRRVLGTLPVTADGVVAMPGAFVYAKWWNGTCAKGFVRHEVHGLETVCFVEMTTTTDDGRTIGIRTFLSDCYSTREAAEAAKEAK